MALALIVLAIGSVLAGYVGVPPRLAGTTRLAHGSRRRSTHARSRRLPASRSARPVRQAEPGEAGGERGLELTLMVVSSIIAIVGIGLAGVHLAQAARDCRPWPRRASAASTGCC